jgi:hypothetical protein
MDEERHPREREAERYPSEEENAERQGPGDGSSDQPSEPEEPGPSGPPPESIPGDEGEVPNPKR